MTRPIGLFGGSFDPVHFGHLIAARSVAEQLGLERVLLIPCSRPPHKAQTRLTDGRHRLAMLRLAVADDPLFEVSDVELARDGPSYTFDTVQTLRARFGAAELCWIIGADSLPELPGWHRAAELVESVRIVTAVRPGWCADVRSDLAAALGRPRAEALWANRLTTPEVEISATDIRGRIAGGLSIRYLTAEPVRAYIAQHGLYSSGGRPRAGAVITA